MNEIAIATTVTILLVLLSVYIFFLSGRAIPLLGLSLITPVMMTFGVAELTVDYLNTSTAFLGSIIIGNGIEPKIMGEGLDLHPVTILLGLVFWGLLWGVVGMLLAAPIMAVVRLVLGRFETTRAVGELLAGRLPDGAEQAA